MRNKLAGSLSAICLALILCLCLPGLQAGTVMASDSGELVIEVIEDISAEDMEELEDEEVPLAAMPKKKGTDYSTVLLMGSAAAMIAAAYWFRNRERARLIRQRREGYREEQRMREQRGKK